MNAFYLQLANLYGEYLYYFEAQNDYFTKGKMLKKLNAFEILLDIEPTVRYNIYQPIKHLSNGI